MKDEELGKAAKQVTLKEFMAAEDTQGLLKEVSFELGLKLLDELVARVESGTLPLDKAILAYEKGTLLVTHLRESISGVEEKLKILKKSSAEA